MSIRGGYDLTGSPTVQSDLYRRYDCLQSQISNATGTSVCSPEQLCAEDWLFSDIGFALGDIRINAPLLFYYIMFFLLTVILIAPFFGVFLKWGIDAYDGKQLTWERTKAYFVKFMNWCLFASFMGILVVWGVAISIGMMHHFITSWKVSNFAATVNYDLGCQAVHIAVSPWSQYLDVKTKGWEQRIVKMWFNA
jgi:hypothetical protein